VSRDEPSEGEALGQVIGLLQRRSLSQSQTNTDPMQMDLDPSKDLIEEVTKKVVERMNGSSTVAKGHFLDTILVRDLEGSERFHVRFLGERIKAVSYEDARSKVQAEDVAFRSAETLRRGLQKLFSESALPDQ